jgi:superfamily II DNA/RNA helicase
MEKVVVCTDVAARGRDIPSVSSTIHYDVATAADTFVHRAGRTVVSNLLHLCLVYRFSLDVRCDLTTMKKTTGIGLESPIMQG